MTILRLGGRNRMIAEPVFKHLRMIIKAYNQLAADSPTDEKIAAAEIILACVTDSKVKLRHLKNGELDALLQAIPDLCGLTPAPNGAIAPATNWGNIYAHLSATLGWTYDYIDNHMKLSRLDEYQGYLAKYPPTHQLVAAYLGYEAQDKNTGSQFLAAIAAQAKANNRKLSS